MRGLKTTPKCIPRLVCFPYAGSNWSPLTPLLMKLTWASLKAAFLLTWAKTLGEMHAGPGYVFGLLSQRKITFWGDSVVESGIPAQGQIYLILWMSWLIMQHSLKATCSAFLAMPICILLLGLDGEQVFNLHSGKTQGGPPFSKHEASPWPTGNMPLDLVHLLWHYLLLQEVCSPATWAGSTR